MGASYAYTSASNSQLYIDEITYARLSYSLIQGHLASDSSLLPIYQRFGIVRNDIHTPFGYVDSVEPWLDHPPLVPILLIPVLMAGASPRLLPVIFSSANAFLMFWLLRKERALAWAATLAWMSIFITHPILSMLFIDSGVAFFGLLSATLISEYSRTGSKRPLYFAGVTAGASALSKLFGVATLLYLFVYVAYARFKPSRESASRISRPLLLAIGIALSWPFYGLAIAPSLFIQLQQFNAARSVFSGNLSGLIFVASFNWSQVIMYPTGIDPFLVTGWIAMAYSFSRRNLWVTQMSPVFYILTVFCLRYGWFYTMIPLYPFFAIGMGVIARDLVSLLWRVPFGRTKTRRTALRTL